VGTPINHRHTDYRSQCTEKIRKNKTETSVLRFHHAARDCSGAGAVLGENRRTSRKRRFGGRGPTPKPTPLRTARYRCLTSVGSAWLEGNEELKASPSLVELTG